MSAQSSLGTGLALAERGLLPEAVLRAGIRRLLRQRLDAEAVRHEDRVARLASWLEHMAASPIALASAEANAQHYEVPAAFYERVLGAQRKYSSAYFPPAVRDLDVAEEVMLNLYAERAGLADGQRILELGCGWGSFTLWAARNFPRARVLGVSGSASQREHILEAARDEGLTNVEIVTADMNDFDPSARFDRVVSIEMFEHMRNWAALLARVRRWLAPGGRAFVHIFSHARYVYPFEDEGDDDWMARHFFTGGMMPSHDLLTLVDADMGTLATWRMNGRHYARTAEAWHRNLLDRRGELTDILGGGKLGALRLARWRIFFLSCAELFGWDDGRAWGVSHYLLAPR